MSGSQPIGNVTNPIVVGGSLIALRYKDGIIIGSDNLLCYGGLLKYDGVCRYEMISDKVVLTATGEYADFQEATWQLRALNEASELAADGIHLSPQDYTNFLTRICYKKRNDQNPFYNNFILAGYDGTPHLATVDLHGSCLVKDYAVAGFAKHFGFAIVANEWRPDATLNQCKEIIRKSFMVIFERVCQASDYLQFTVVKEDGVRIYEAQKLESRWDFKEFRERKNQTLWQ